MTERRRAARRLPRDPGASGWNALLPAPAPARVLDEPRSADWLIIGGGFAGLAAARRLSQLRGGDRVALLEATRIGAGPAGRNSGFMIDLPHELNSSDYAGAEAEADARATAMNRAAIAFAREAAEEYGLPAEAIDPCGKINGAASAQGLAHNASYARHLAAMGENCQLLDAAEMRARTGTEYYFGGLFTPGAAILQPAMFVRGVADGLARTIDIYEDSPVTALSRVGNGRGLWRAETPGGSITAPKVILAVNGHVESFGFFERRLMHVILYASMSRALSDAEARRLGGERKWGITPCDPMGSTVRRISGTGGDRIVIRNRVTYDPSMEASGARIAAMARWHERAFAARFPMLDGVTMEHRWGGRLCLSRNSAPAFGEVDEGVVAACCQNGLGAAKGTFSGMMAAELSAQGDSPLLADMLAQPGPSRLPPEPFASLGASAYLRWKEHRAGREL